MPQTHDETQTSPPSPAPAQVHPADTLKTILDFVAKCFYPCIAAYVLLALMPSIQTINLKELVDRLRAQRIADRLVKLGIEFRTNHGATELRRGDIQILVF